MSRLSLQGLGYRYPSAARPALAGVDLELDAGEILLLTGPTGCGKSTLLRLVAGLAQRHGQGEVLGRVQVDGQDPAAMAPAQRVRVIGLVGQEPGDQLVTGRVADEVSFAMESACWSPAQMQARIPELLAAVGLHGVQDRDPRQLSGGQTQRLVTAAALAAGAGLLVLDEPLAQLDPQGAAELLQRLRRLADQGIAVLLVEHRIAPCLEVADRLAIMDHGRLLQIGRVAELRPGDALLSRMQELGLQVPRPEDLARRPSPGLAPLPERLAERSSEPPAAAPGAAPLLSLRGLRFRYPGAERELLCGLDLELHRGERVALMGGNGVGKSTLLGILEGRLPGGPGTRAPDCVAIPQDADLALFCPTVREELAYGPRERGRPLDAAALDALAHRFRLLDLLDQPPQALSRGQRLRVAVAAALACAPGILLLDEPTSGQDHAQVQGMMRALSEDGQARLLLFATHDLELALLHASRILYLDQGRILFERGPAVRPYEGA